MPLVVFFDTNSLFRMNLKNNDRLKIISQHAKTYGIRLCLNRVVYLELKNQRDREIRFVRQFFTTWQGIFKGQASIPLNELEITSFSLDRDLIQPLHVAGIEIIENQLEDIAIGIDSMYQGRKPAKKAEDEIGKVKKDLVPKFTDPDYVDYNYQENGIKDVFIWRSIVSLVRDQPEIEVAFISKNTDDFCAPGSKELHPDLSSEYEGPEHGTILIVDDLQSFIEQHVDFVEGFQLRAGDVIRTMELSQILPRSESSIERSFLEIEAVEYLEITGFCRFRTRLKMRVMEYSSEEESLDNEVEPQEKVLDVELLVGRAAQGNETGAYAISPITPVLATY